MMEVQETPARLFYDSASTSTSPQITWLEASTATWTSIVSPNR